ncbi:hypothetical protein B0H10DRAFT_1997936 [Mycena sp. CBHHK59/15]|nr:hypothetical protein B0H10DRAFT_1997936 [Mycena sp. CBHHK59/15]
MEVKLKTPTCARCRVRKIRCNGLNPCTSCRATSRTCEYEGDTKQNRSGPELRKGAACLACRRKKKKCDGRLPCRTCSFSKKKDNCEYPDGIFEEEVNLPRMAIMPALSDASVASGSSPDIPTSVSAGEPTLRDYALDIPTIHSPSPFTISSSDSANYIGLAEIPHARDIFLEQMEKLVPTVSDAMPTALARDESGNSTEQDFPGISYSTLHSPSPFAHSTDTNPDSADQAGSDELSQARELFSKHRMKLGLSVSEDKLAALSSGDSSGAIVHPALLHACQLTGNLLAHHPQSHAWLFFPEQSQQEIEQTQLVFDSLTQVGDKSPCPVTSLQAFTLVSLYFLNKGDVLRFREMLFKGNHIVIENKIDLSLLEAAATSEPQPLRKSFSINPKTPAAEAQGAFSHLIYLDLVYSIILKVPSILHPRLLANFRRLIDRPVSNTETNFIRAKSAFLLYEAQHLDSRWRQEELGQQLDAAAEWQKTYWELMEEIDEHRSFLTVTLTKIAFCPKLRTMGLALKACTIMLLTGSAQLISLFESDDPELMHRKHDAVVQVVSITSTFTDEDCEYLDPILSTCWEAVVRSLDTCIAAGPLAVGGTLHNLQGMACVIRQVNKTLQRVFPYASEI